MMSIQQIKLCEKCSKNVGKNDQYNISRNYFIDSRGCEFCIHPKCRCRYFNSNSNNFDPNCCFNKHEYKPTYANDAQLKIQIKPQLKIQIKPQLKIQIKPQLKKQFISQFKNPNITNIININ